MIDTNSLYHEKIKRYAESGHASGVLATPSGEAKLSNALCGDRVRVQIRMGGGRIVAVAHESKGCLLCRAAASLIGSRAVGLDRIEMEAVVRDLERILKCDDSLPDTWVELSMFSPAYLYPSRHKCILLPFHVLVAALQNCDLPVDFRIA